MRIPALIPLANGNAPVSGCLQSLARQTVCCYPVLCYAQGVEGDTNRNYNPERVKGEARARKVQQINALAIGAKYILTIDRDVVLTNNSAIEKLVQILDREPRTGAVAVNFDGQIKIRLDLPHVDMKCMLYRTELFAKIDFDIRMGCLCKTSIEHLKKLRYKTRYESFVIRGEEKY